MKVSYCTSIFHNYDTNNTQICIPTVVGEGRDWSVTRL